MELDGVELVVVAAIGLMAFALIPASVASNKGYSFGLFWVGGLLLVVPALIVAVLLPTRA